MNQTDNPFSTQKITPQLIGQIVDAIKNKAYGSVEIYIHNYNVTQITERTITKIQQTISKIKRTPQNISQDQQSQDNLINSNSSQ